MLMATREDVLTWIANGENSSVEFKRDTAGNERLAREVVAFANSDGGVILLGVDDDGTIAGNADAKTEEWVMTACRDKVSPPIIPHFQRVVGVVPGRDVAVVRVERSYTAHHLWHNSHRTWLIRVGSQSREASQEELARLLQRRQVFRCDSTPIQGSSLAHLDRQRLRDYFVRVREQSVPDDGDAAGWRTLLANTEILDNDSEDAACTLAGLLLFGAMPSRWLPQSGVDVAAYAGTSKLAIGGVLGQPNGGPIAVQATDTAFAGEDGRERGLVYVVVPHVARPLLHVQRRGEGRGNPGILAGAVGAATVGRPARLPHQPHPLKNPHEAQHRPPGIGAVGVGHLLHQHAHVAAENHGGEPL